MIMDDPHQQLLEARSQYATMESMALASAVALSLAAVLANLLFPSSIWFLGGNAVCGVLMFLAWRAAVVRIDANAVYLAVLVVAAAALSLVFEIDRSTPVNMACGISLAAAVMFWLIEAARRFAPDDRSSKQ